MKYFTGLDHVLGVVSGVCAKPAVDGQGFESVGSSAGVDFREKASLGCGVRHGRHPEAKGG